MRPLLAGALARLRRRRGRALLAAAGIAAAAAMTGAAVTVSYNLHDGFARSADEAGIPDVIVHFDPHAAGRVAARVKSLPNIASVSLQLEQRPVVLRTRGHAPITSGDLLGTVGTRHGYKIVAGRDLSGRTGEVVIERGLASQWHLHPGDRITVGGPSTGGAVGARVVGVAVAPDNVAYPLASGARIWMPYRVVAAIDGAAGQPVNTALLWVNDRSQLGVTLEQARAASYGLSGVNFVTREGVGVLIDGAAGIVIALLVAVSLGALVGAGVMVVASSRAEVQRRLETIALLRAIGASPRAITGAAAVEAAMVALPSATLGLAVGWWAAAGASARLLEALDQFPRGAALLLPLSVCLVAIVALVAAASAWPTWRACRRPVAAMLRDAELPTGARALRLPAGTIGLGMRIAVARPVRTAATTVVMATSAAVVLLLLGLATTLQRLEHDPGTIGKNYQLTSHSGVLALPRIRRLPGVADAAQRFSSPVADSFQLGETFNLVSYCGNRLRFEDPPLAAGRRATSPGEAEVGQGLATALGLVPGGTLAVQFGDGEEARFHVTGVVRTLDNDGRVAYVQPGVEVCGFRGGQTVIQLKDGADQGAVTAALNLTGNRPATVGGVTSRNAAFLGVLATLLRTIAVIDGLVCLYVLAQMLALTALERRGAVGLLRACGADRTQVGMVFFGAASVVVAVALPVAVLVERLVLGPRAADLAASYATVSLRAGTAEVLLALAGLVLIAVVASAWVARRALAEPITRLLRDD
ncbi:MAG TPA: FtsX-like permease family protein [Gaiellales bacterium]|nr:FtsX-like permease family protein [Gaiellales bacterium]